MVSTKLQSEHMSSPEERLATLESQMGFVLSNVNDIKISLKHLETIAASGNGAFRTALIIGGVMGWVVSVGLALTALFKH